jgi:hypothetical protein
MIPHPVQQEVDDEREDPHGKILEIRKGTTPEAEHVDLYRLLGVPRQIIHPQRTWIRPPGPST